MSRGRFMRDWGTPGLGDDSLFPDESLDIGAECVGRLTKGEFEVISREGDVVFGHFELNITCLVFT